MLIELSDGQFATVDDHNHEWLSRYSWSNTAGYARGYVGGRWEYMHRLIAKAKPNEQVDHKDRNRLNNLEANLRICTIQQNSFNRSHGTRLRGVTFMRQGTHRTKPFRARIGHSGKVITLGYFATEREAAICYNGAAKVLFGKFANLNNV